MTDEALAQALALAQAEVDSKQLKGWRWIVQPARGQCGPALASPCQSLPVLASPCQPLPALPVRWETSGTGSGNNC